MTFGRVDRYITRVFWSSYGVAFLFFFGAFMVIDLFAHVDEFVETARDESIAGGRMMGYIAAFYLYSSPSIFLQVAPFVTVIGVIVCVARLMGANELIPMLMSGRSIYRVLMPVFLNALLLTTGMILLQELVAPATAERRIRIGEYITDGEELQNLDLPIEDHQGNTFRGIRYDIEAQRIVHAKVTRRKDDTFEFSSPVSDLTYDGSAAPPGWVSPRPFRWTRVHGDLEPVTEKATFIESSLDPAQISALMKEAFDLSFADLGYLYAMTGEARYKVLLHYHLTFPLTNVLLLLLALPFVLRYEQKSRLAGLAAAFAICGLYFGADFALRGLGENHLNPVLAAWFTPIFFGALGISLSDGVRT